MWSSDNSAVAPIAPQRLERAMDNQRVEYPDDDAAINRLFEHLKLSRPTLREVAESVCQLYCIGWNELIDDKSRKSVVALARQIFFYVAHKYTRTSLKGIGRYLGGRDHSTVIHGVRKITHLVATRAIFHDDIDLLRLLIAEKVLQRPVKMRAS
jgi:chromosomal replication initiation ATPase DnaA